MLYSVPSGVLGILYPTLMAALLGIGDGVFMTQLNALLGILFKNDTVLASPVLMNICFFVFLFFCFVFFTVQYSTSP